MEIDQVKSYLKKAKDFREIGCKAIVKLSEYLKSEFEGFITINSQDECYLKLDCLGYNLTFEVEIDWKKEHPKIILKATHQKVNVKYIFEENTLVKYSIGSDGFVSNSDKSNVGHLDTIEKYFQSNFIADVFSKIIETENNIGIHPMEPGKTYAAGK